MLDENNTGWILNIMHSRQGCYAYVKDIVKELIQDAKGTW